MANTIGSAVGLGAATRERVPLTMYDAGWVVLCIGMAIGSGVVFMPL